MEQPEATSQKDIIGISPKTVKLYGFALTGFLVPLFGIFPSLVALFKAKSAKREIIASEGKLGGLDLYKQSLLYAWLGIVSFFINLGLIALLIWLINELPALIASPQFQDTLNNNLYQFMPQENLNLDLKGLGFSDADIEAFKNALPEGKDIDNLTLQDILKLAEEYGIN